MHLQAIATTWAVMTTLADLEIDTHVGMDDSAFGVRFMVLSIGMIGW